MLSRSAQSSYATTSRELVLLLLASLACVIVLTAGIVHGEGTAVTGVSFSQLTVIAFTVLAGIVGVTLVFKTVTAMRQRVASAQNEAASLKRQLAIAEAVIGGEPQILVLWDTGLHPRIINNSLNGVPGLPSEDAQVIAFSNWLDGSAVQRFQEALDRLLRLGQPFNMIVRTTHGAHLEADGRASSGRAVLRIRDVAGYKRDISRIIDGHEGLARDIHASRAILNSLPMPVWFRDPHGRLT